MRAMGALMMTAFSIASVAGQTYQRQATITGSSYQDRGKCTVEVVVDGTADVQLRGTNGVIQNRAGQPPQWRRFECTSPMPTNPLNFRVSGVAGRGRQTLITDPSRTGVAVVRIDDPAGGAQAYKFDVEWQGGTTDNILQSFGAPAAGNAQITSAQGVEACQHEVFRQASQRFRTSDVYFRRIQIDNARGGQDRIRGTLDVGHSANNSNRYRFDCAINLRTGRIVNAQIDANPARANTPDYGYPNNNTYTKASQRAMQACESAVTRRLNDQGYQRAGFGSIDFDERNSSGNRLFGSARVNDRSGRGQIVDFACTVDLNTGSVQSADVIPRHS
jgi:hypothetical protein